jgi:hypothetical protein
MGNLITVILFISLAINIPTAIANIIGLNLQIDDKSCLEEVKSVKLNRRVVKWVQYFNVIVLLVVMILFQIFFVV